MFCLPFKRTGTRGRELLNQVQVVGGIFRPNVHPINLLSVLNSYNAYPNLKILHRKVSLNDFGLCFRRLSRMEEHLRATWNSDSTSTNRVKKTSAFKPLQITTTRGPRRLQIKNVQSSILGHLNKDPRFRPLQPLQKASATKVTNHNTEAVANEPSANIGNGAHQNYFQEMVFNFSRRNTNKYQVNDISPQLSPTFGCSSSYPSSRDDHNNRSPKEQLHNCLQAVAAHFGADLYSLNPPTFLETKVGVWSCIYSLAWPFPMHFNGQGHSKKEASQNSARKALTWLKFNNYIDDLQRPLRKQLATLPNSQIRFSPAQARAYSTYSRVDLNTTNIVEQASPPSNAQEIKHLRTLYPSPKNTLHNYFQIVSNELKQKDLTVTPHYITTKQKQNSSWTCTYNLKWPELLKFACTAPTKKDASYKAALSALAWLTEKKKITKDGKPLIYDRKEMTKITKKSYPVIAFDHFVEDKMNEIVEVYKNDLVQELVTDLGEDGSLESAGEELDEKWPQPLDVGRSRQTFMGLQFYEAKEPVKLPISGYKDEIIDLLQNNRVLIVKGEPGCGKSTRVPQYVLEAWARDGADDGQPCRIVVTQPRRIAAISLAERVSNEREESVGDTVGYHVRLRSNFNKRTGRIMYCTTGILLRRLQSDPKLSDCSHIILDEAHERDVNTDLLMNLTRHALKLNPNLKVLVMSATMEAKVFQDYFGNAPVLHIPGFTYPVQDHFLNEHNFPKTQQMCTGQYPSVVPEDVVKQLGYIHKNKPEGAILCFLPGWDEITKVRNLLPYRDDISVLCLHSRLQVSEQKLIFSRPPPGVRKIILATNIAETSITIDDVVYVLDTGIHKEERFDVDKGVNCIDNHWISQASATQRKGRAGRCQAGECFHFYPHSKYEQFEQYSIPEILRTSLTKIVLDSKVYSNNMNAVEFLQQLVCPPDTTAVEKAVQELKELELLDENENLTPLGRTLSDFQLAPKLSKAMVNAVIFKCVTPVIDITTLFSAESALFAKSLGGQMEVKDVKSKFSRTSDHIAMMRLFEMWLEFVERNSFDAASNFCEDTGLVQHKLHTIRKLRDIHFDYLTKGLTSALPLADDFSDNDELVKAVLLSGVGTLLQHRTWDFVKGLLKKTNVLLTSNNQKATITSESVNTRRGKFPSDFLLYINETISNLRHTTLVREASIISPLTALLFKNGNLEIEEISKENYSPNLKSDDQIILKLEGTKIGFFCDRKQAETIKECKEALRACVQYYIYQLTKGGEKNETVNFHWNEILRSLDDILVLQNVEQN